MDDFERIRRLLALYAQLLDSGRLSEWGDLFTADATFSVYGRTHRGRDEIVREIGGMQPGPGASVKHLLLAPVIDLGPDGQALAWTDVTVFAAESGGPTRIATIGRYHDRLLREDGRWRFCERVLIFPGEPLPDRVAPVPAF